MSPYTLSLNPSELVRYRRMARDAVRAEARIWRRAGVRPGARVADIGCGPGMILVELARMVSPGGTAVGVERDPDARAAAKATIKAAETRQALVVAGHAAATGLELESFDVVMMRHVLLHNRSDQALPIISHLTTLLRSGGALIMVEADRTAHRWESSPASVVLELHQRYAQLLERNGSDLGIGPKLGALARAAGLEVIIRSARYDVVPPQADGRRPYSWASRQALVGAGLATPAEVEAWDHALTELGPSIEPVVYLPMFVVVARKN